jgi:hypothetical protein
MGFVFTPMPRDTKAAYTQNWNFNLQKGIGQSTVLHVAYVANVGRHLSGFYDPNRIDPVTHTRPFPDYGSMTQFWSCCNSSYNSLQVSLRHRFSHGLTFNVNYTWAHSFDQSEWAYGTQPQNDHRLDLEKASADYDIRHLLQFDYTYQLPAAPGIPKWLGSGWQINGLTVMRSGTSVNVIWPVDVEGTGSVTWTKARPNVVAGVSPRPANYSIPFNQINYAAFSDPGSHFGNLGRNTLKGPAVFNWDFSLFKNFKVREGHELQFRAEMFNIFNTPQYAAPAADFSNPATFGKSLTTINAAGGFGSNRQMQFALKYIF